MGALVWGGLKERFRHAALISGRLTSARLWRPRTDLSPPTPQLLLKISLKMACVAPRFFSLPWHCGGASLSAACRKQASHWGHATPVKCESEGNGPEHCTVSPVRAPLGRPLLTRGWMSVISQSTKAVRCAPCPPLRVEPSNEQNLTKDAQILNKYHSEHHRLAQGGFQQRGTTENRLQDRRGLRPCGTLSSSH